MDLDAVRTFVAAAAAGQFAEAADDLSITQQAVSKRIAALEKDLGVRLFTRTARGARLTTDGQAFLPHARDLLQAEERAAASVRPGRRALRVDVIGGGSPRPPCCAASTARTRDRTRCRRPSSTPAPPSPRPVRTLDASCRRRHGPRVFDEAVQFLSPGPPLAAARAVTPATCRAPDLDARHRPRNRVGRVLR